MQTYDDSRGNDSNYKLQSEIIRKLNSEPKNSESVTKLAKKLGRRQEEVSRQLRKLLKYNLVSFEEKPDYITGKNTHSYNLTTLGRICKIIVTNFSMISTDLSQFVNSDSKIIKECVEKSINYINVDDKAIEKNEEPIRYCELADSFHDQSILYSLEKMKIPVKEQIKRKTSNERLEMVLDKKCDITMIPTFTLDEISKNDSKQIVVIGAINNNCMPPHLVVNNRKKQDVVYEGGYSRRRLASTITEKPSKVTESELLNGVKDQDFKSFVLSNLNYILFQEELGFKSDNSLNHDSFIITNEDAVLANSHIKSIYREHYDLLRYYNTGMLTKNVVDYVKDELIPYIRRNENIFQELNKKINSEISN